MYDFSHCTDINEGPNHYSRRMRMLPPMQLICFILINRAWAQTTASFWNLPPSLLQVSVVGTLNSAAVASGLSVSCLSLFFPTTVSVTYVNTGCTYTQSYASITPTSATIVETASGTNGFTGAICNTTAIYSVRLCCFIIFGISRICSRLAFFLKKKTLAGH